MDDQTQELARLAVLVRDDEAVWATLSTGEQLFVALLLNRADLVRQAGHTLSSAIQRVGPAWMALLPGAAEALRAMPHA